MKYLLAVLIAASMLASAAEQSAVAVDGKNITVKYAPAVAEHKIIASFHTDADLVFKGATVPKGDYSLYVLIATDKWQVAINKQPAAKAQTYDPKLDVGRVAVNLAKAPAAVPNCKLTLTKTAAMAAKLEIAFENTVGAVPFHLDRVAGDSEW
jgi:hypothetical protein